MNAVPIESALATTPTVTALIDTYNGDANIQVKHAARKALKDLGVKDERMK